MHGHDRRFIDTGAFKSHTDSLNPGSLRDSELEFYEQQCLLLPAVWFYQPHTSPEDLTPPESLRRLKQRHVDGLHPFDAELGHNPLLVAPDCSKFEPWEADDRIIVTAPDGHTVRRPVFERYYAPWQVHVVALLRKRKHYYVHSRFLRHIDPSHDLWKWHRIPEDTEQTRSLRGMANGFDALERFQYANQAALNKAFDGVPTGESLPKAAQAHLRSVLTRWAQQALTKSSLDEPAFFVFLGKLAPLIDDYRRDERVALAEDAEEYLLDAQALAREAFTYDWEEFLAAAEEHAGAGVAAELRRLDPVEAAARAARTNLKWTLDQAHLAMIVSGRGVTIGYPTTSSGFAWTTIYWRYSTALSASPTPTPPSALIGSQAFSTEGSDPSRRQGSSSHAASSTPLRTVNSTRPKRRPWVTTGRCICFFRRMRCRSLVRIWGRDEYGRATPPEGSFVSVSAGYEYTCGVRSDGSLACWGVQARGETASDFPPSTGQ